ncbi:MAG TPA: hypothetical protein VHM70_22880 [Polyangiaceae bacterium]|jgi:hypothetical protein|nr:hypothetical protein [Polyangiaceae bacterium]
MHTQTESHVAQKLHYSTFAVGPFAVLVWHERISVEGVESVARVFARLSEAHAEKGFGFLTIIENEADVSTSPAARNAMSKALTDHERCLRAAAIAYEADGFKATIVRSVVTAINLIAGARFPNRVFRDNREALKWLGQKLDFKDLDRQPQLQRYLR